MQKTRYIKYIALILSLVAMVFAVSCNGENGGEIKDTAAPSSDLGNDTTTEDQGNGTDAPDEISRYIHSILELNKDEGKIDSHAGVESSSSLEGNFRTKLFKFKSQKAYYPRIKMLADGSYFMVFHDSDYGGNIYYSTSKDGKNWKMPKKVFSLRSIEYKGTEDKIAYMTPDAVVLDNGDIIIVTSYRIVHAYQKAIEMNGIAIKRSKDGGSTWSEEKAVYVGTNWEPSILEADNGEIYIYSTVTAPSIYETGNFDLRSSGVGLIRSKDGGNTWTPNVTGAPYLPQYVMRQYVCTENGVKRYNDQMPVAIQLHNGTIALAVETQNFSKGTYKFSISYNNDGYKADLGMNTSGPKERQTEIFNLAGPYLDQFHSGEVALVYHFQNKFYARIGNSTATRFNKNSVIMNDAGCWGNILVNSSHTALVSIGREVRNNDSTAKEKFGIDIMTLVLNHRISAKKMTPSLSADTAEWDKNTDALFAGSDSQAQLALRFAHDGKNIYFLAERLDSTLASDDTATVLLCDEEKGYYQIELDTVGIKSFRYSKSMSGSKTTVKAEVNGVVCKTYIDGTVDKISDQDNGIIHEIAIPRSLISAGKETKVCFYIRLRNSQNGSCGKYRHIRQIHMVYCSL